MLNSGFLFSAVVDERTPPLLRTRIFRSSSRLQVLGFSGIFERAPAENPGFKTRLRNQVHLMGKLSFFF